VLLEFSEKIKVRVGIFLTFMCKFNWSKVGRGYSMIFSEISVFLDFDSNKIAKDPKNQYFKMQIDFLKTI
jgi:hypothetical protein